MLDDRTQAHTRVPDTLYDEDWLTPSIGWTYTTARYFAHWKSRASGWFSRSSASIENVASKGRQSQTTVKSNLKILEKQGRIYRKRRWNESSITTFVPDSAAFREATERDGKEAAVAQNEERLETLRNEARKMNARQANHEQPDRSLLTTTRIESDRRNLAHSQTATGPPSARMKPPNKYLSSSNIQTSPPSSGVHRCSTTSNGLQQRGEIVSIGEACPPELLRQMQQAAQTAKNAPAPPKPQKAALASIVDHSDSQSASRQSK